MTAPLEPGDVVQANPEATRWGPVFVIVEQVRAWGVQGYFLVHTQEGGVGQAPIRLSHDQFVRIGAAVWTFQDNGPDMPGGAP